jgi:hypothetical protein
MFRRVFLVADYSVVCLNVSENGTSSQSQGLSNIRKKKTIITIPYHLSVSLQIPLFFCSLHILRLK